ncbi:7223_t:CDS:2, partial [Gigaspora rosea]
MSGGRIFPVCPLIQSNINCLEMFKSDNQKSIKVISNINYSEMLNTEMLKIDDQKSPLLESTAGESADEAVKAGYRRIAKETLRVPLELREFIEKRLKKLNVRTFNYLHFRELKLFGSGRYADVYSAKFYGKQYAMKSPRNTLHKDAMPFIHEESDLDTFVSASQ